MNKSPKMCVLMISVARLTFPIDIVSISGMAIWVVWLHWLEATHII